MICKQIINTINTNYLGTIAFAIQRVFNSPTGSDIVTNLSESFILNGLQNSSIIPDNIEIVPVSKDKEKMNLKRFFKPKSTIVYFYKFISINNITYGYENDTPNSVSSSVLKFNNNGNNMFSPNIKYKDISTVYQNNEYQYNIQYLTTITSYMDKPSFIDFSILSPLRYLGSLDTSKT